MSAESGGLTGRTLVALRWTYMASALGAVLQVVFAAVMGRLLDPTAYGLFAIANLALRFGAYVARMGVGQAIVQREDLRDEHVRAGFASAVGLSAAVAVVFALVAPMVAAGFREPAVTGILRGLALTLVLQGLGSTSEALLRRDLRFRFIAIAETASYVLGYFVIGLALAAAGAGAWALVGAALGQQAILSVLCVAAVRHPIAPPVRWAPYRALLGFGGRVSAISFLEFLGDELDTLTVGRIAGAAPLGQYNRAWLLTRLPSYHATTGLTRVLFPGLSSIQRDTARLRQAYLAAAGGVALVIGPLCAGMAVAAPELVAVLLGPQWGPAADVLPFLAAATALGMLSHVAGVVCEARGVLDAKLRLQAVHVAGLAALLALAAGGPLPGYAAALAGGEVLRQALYARLLSRELGVRPRQLRQRFAPALLAAAVVAAAVAAVRAPLVASGAPDVAVLVADVVAGALALAAAVRFGPGAARNELRTRLDAAGVLRSARARRLATLALGPVPVPRGAA